jgi:hypothetical protein
MNTQSMRLAAITAFSGIGAVHADRVGLNKQKNNTDSSSGEVLVGSPV